MKQAAADLAEKAEPRDNEEAVFYSWIDAGTQSQPSSLVLRISGGERRRDPSDGKVMALGYHEVRFNMGILRTSDPDEIREIRRMISKGETITEDKEVYLSHVEPAERRGQRLAQKSSVLTAELEHKDAEVKRKDAEIRRLNSLLEKRVARTKQQPTEQSSIDGE